MIKTEFKAKADSKVQMILPVFADEKTYPAYINDWLTTLVKRKEFAGKSGQMITFHNTGKSGPKKVLVVGLGKKAKLSANKVRVAMAQVTKKTSDKISIQLNPELIKYAQAMAEGLEMGNYLIGAFKTGKAIKAAKKKLLTKVTYVATKVDAKTKKAIKDGHLIGEGVNHVRDLVNAPHNIMNCTYYANHIKEIGKKNGYKTTVFEKKQLEKMGMGALLGVNAGSAIGAKLAVMEYMPNGRKQKPIALVGKCVTFDTGGLGLKPDSAMDWMKMDMAGGGVVMGVFTLLKQLGIKQNVVGLVPITDNAVDAYAQKPNDIVTSYSGKTIEIGHTDAEGRLILADAMSYGVSKYKPSAVIDLATLTGAVMVALGCEYAGVFSNNDKVRDGIMKASKTTDEECWPLPIHKDHKKAMKGKFSDLNNISGQRYGGASTAAAFLSEFIGKTPWAHVDIAGTAKPVKPKEYDHEGSATGYGVRLMVEYLRNQN